ncbi:universal stress protein [Natronobacterium gregoryi]|uniref:Universal stress protein n=2 Tax=Natronobacterium gregoryi TaxID=44930 RepID=L0ANY8_NATGS|nr:universal stress protein [Natronobacterium gregoryi]AFZ74800.1 universal stress protein UspA-like protein [Natronobacterium gregoryi SP2]ELY66132.1 UspA domain-containing protein [Natronobacterium gregoryi SP2]PLK19493.1 universal stress protein [Natronobacterium gregoryi SP2]SFJ43374.1 Nucleotide-binding universal stress protein, UspA family [Natronobacterium gregoryi]
MTAHVLVPVDGSAAADTALEYAHEQFPNAGLTLLYVMDPMADYSRRRSFPGYRDDDEFTNEREKGELVLENAIERLPDDASIETTLESGDPADAIVRYTDDGDVDHVVIGSHGRKSVARFLLGSVAEAVVRRSVVPVTVVRPDE